MTQVVSGISQFTRQNTEQVIVSMTLVLVSSKQARQYVVNIAESSSHVIFNSKAITTGSFNIY